MGTSLQNAVLSDLWKISKQEAEDTVETLWDYGLAQFTDRDITLSHSNVAQHCVEVHAVISQYIIEIMDSQEVLDLTCISLINGDVIKKDYYCHFNNHMVKKIHHYYLL